MNEMLEQELYEAADACDRRAAESFERCDTDGFVSQWCDGLEARRLRQQASIVAAGGTWEFRALFTVDGEWVPAKTLETRYGTRWAVLDERGRFTGVFLPYAPKRRETLAKHGYVEGFVERPAKAVLAGSGHGFSGLATVHVAVEATDNDWDEPQVIVMRDRWAEVNRLWARTD